MKKALVLGVMAFFAINIASIQTVSAQVKQQTNEENTTNTTTTTTTTASPEQPANMKEFNNDNNTNNTNVNVKPILNDDSQRQNGKKGEKQAGTPDKKVMSDPKKDEPEK